MAAPFDLKTPSNAKPVKTDKFAGYPAAEKLREIRVSKATGSILVTVFEPDGKTAMAFYIQGDGSDEDAQDESMRFAAGAYYARAASPEDPSRGRITGEAWTFLVAGENADCIIRVISDLAGCG